MTDATAAHVARHSGYIRDLERNGLDARMAATMRARIAGGFAHHGEEAHHAADFRPLQEGYAEQSDLLDLLAVHPRDRVDLGVVEPPQDPEFWRLYTEAVATAIVAANAYTRLMAYMGAFEEDAGD